MSLAKDQSQVENSARYEEDIYSWASEQGRHLRQLRPTGLDWENVAEEIESLGSEQLHALESCYTLLIYHLLKWQFQPERRSRSWQLTINNSRRQIRRREARNKSLAARSWKIVEEVYGDAISDASLETGLPILTFPEICPYTLDQLRDRDFLPE
ncbi:DUF29 domain-containing protein [Fulvimarina sp. MAC8]|uniref:DUF29 domain-containing protein n=1 Tax=Fulvimarina sp. MAC8 TaxID=3162874 RepID=UPI0032EC1421